MLDNMGREINYLRISITDKCNLRCRYCMPMEGVKQLKHEEILSLEEIARLVQIAATIGIRRVRLTGGCPLVRRNICQLIRYIRSVPEIEEISLTTNGILFPQMADDLKAAGLDRVNISLDSLVPERYRYITRIGDHDSVMRAIDRALELDLEPVKINTVVIRGFNDDEILDFASMAYERPLHIRFIEYMPIGDLEFWNASRMMSSDEVKEVIKQQYELIPNGKIIGNGPAQNYSLAGGRGSVGFISPMSNHFCGSCNRLRLTAEGKLRACLYDKKEMDLKLAISNGASDEDLRQMFVRAISQKPQQHNLNGGWGQENQRKMYQIGG